MTEPRRPQGRMVEIEPGKVFLDSAGAILLDKMECCTVDSSSEEQKLIAVQLSGRVNRTSDRETVLFLVDWQGVARLVGMLMAEAKDVDPRLEQMVVDEVRRQTRGTGG